MEEWRDIPGYDRYQVSDYGRVRSIRRHGYKVLKGYSVRELKVGFGGIRKGKVIAIAVSLSGKKQQVHRLVLLAFRGPCPARMMGCHNDGDPTNNNFSNLRWDTHEANMADMIKHRNCPRRYDKPIMGTSLASAYICGIAGLV